MVHRYSNAVNADYIYVVYDIYIILTIIFVAYMWPIPSQGLNIIHISEFYESIVNYCILFIDLRLYVTGHFLKGGVVWRRVLYSY